MIRAALALALVAVTSVTGGAGRPDPTWGGDGDVTTVLTRGAMHLIQADLWSVLDVRGRIWVSGASTPPGPLHYGRPPIRGWKPQFLLRYLPDGRIDRSFGRSGFVRGLPDVGTTQSLLLALPDGRVVARREWWSGSGLKRVELVRLRHDGSVDPTFGVRGAVRLARPGCPGRVVSLVRQPDGKLVGLMQGCGGEARNEFQLVRLLADGRLDRAFGKGGFATAVVGRNAAVGSSFASGLAREPDGSLVVGGTATIGDTARTVALVRFKSNGRLDASFGTGGIVEMPAVDGEATFGGVVARPDGSLVAAGCDFSGQTTGDRLFLYRLTPDGTPDPGWGTNGILDLGDAYGVSDLDCVRLRAAPQGKLILLGLKLLGRLNEDGSVDTSYGTNGVVRPPVVDQFLVQPDGKVLIAEKTRPTVQVRALRLVRYGS
jgi:uncharacterized delta-60 repeat protein